MQDKKVMDLLDAKITEAQAEIAKRYQRRDTCSAGFQFWTERLAVYEDLKIELEKMDPAEAGEND